MTPARWLETGQQYTPVEARLQEAEVTQHIQYDASFIRASWIDKDKLFAIVCDVGGYPLKLINRRAEATGQVF